MAILRSIAAVVVGWIVAVVFIMGIESANALIYLPEGKTFLEVQKEFEECTPWAKEWVKTLPLGAHAMLQVGWGCGAFFGGLVAALIAGRARMVHAGVIGALVLMGTIVNFYQLKVQMDYAHPDWLIVTGLLLPLPLSLLAGKLVSMWLPDATPESPSGTVKPKAADGAIKQGEPPFRSQS